MKISSVLLTAVTILLATASLQAGEFTLYGSSQKTGRLKYSSETDIPEGLLDNQHGSVFGIRLASGGAIGYEQNISFSPRFARPGVKAFQMDSNLLLQGTGRVAPYAAAGLGFITTWGQDFPRDPDPEKIAAAAFSFGYKFSINYGGGIKLRRVIGPLGFNVDVRGYTVPSARDGSLFFAQMSFGAVFTW